MKKLKLICWLLPLSVLLPAQPPQMVKDIYPGPSSSYIIYLTVYDSVVIFKAKNTANDFEPWRTNGTAEGTYMIKDIKPGANGSNPSKFVVCNGLVFFAADDGTYGTELWKTDGTEEGTVMVNDINPGAAHAGISEIVCCNGLVYFRAYNPAYGYELWVSNGDPASTFMVKDIVEGSTSFDPYNIICVDTVVYFMGRLLCEDCIGVFRSDGSADGTYRFMTKGNTAPEYHAFFNDFLYYNYHDSLGNQLWRSVNDNNHRISQIVDQHSTLDPRHLTVVKDKLMFVGEQFPHGRELWACDTLDIFYMVKDINPAGHGNLSKFFIEFKDKLIFSAGVAGTGVELWVSDGSEEGTYMIQDINPGMLQSGLVNPVKIDDVLYFSADDGTGGEIWMLAHPDSLPRKFTNIEDGGAWGELVKLGDTFFFMAGDAATGTELWMMKASSGNNGNTNIPQINNPVKNPAIFPNPVTGIATVSIPGYTGKALVEMYNLHGQKQHSFYAHLPEFTMNMPDIGMPDGIYFLKITTDKKAYHLKFVVKKNP